jgi:hypothetical protein
MRDTNRKFNIITLSLHLLYGLDKAGYRVLIDRLIHALRNNYIAIYCRLIMDKRLGKVYNKANMAYKVLYLHFPGMTKEKKGNPQSR